MGHQACRRYQLPQRTAAHTPPTVRGTRPADDTSYLKELRPTLHPQSADGDSRLCGAPDMKTIPVTAALKELRPTQAEEFLLFSVDDPLRDTCMIACTSIMFRSKPLRRCRQKCRFTLLLEVTNCTQTTDSHGTVCM